MKERLSTVRYLLSTTDIKPISFNIDDNTPLDLVPPHCKLRTEIFKLFYTFEECRNSRTNFAVENYSKVFVCGDTTVGKSSLCQVINFQSLSSSQHHASEYVFGATSLIGNVESHTISSSKVGNIVMYDLTGHPQHYSSHVMVLEYLMLRSAAVFVVLFNLTTQLACVERELRYWFNFIENISVKSSKLSQVIVVGSHADVFTGNTEVVRSLVFQTALQGIQKHKFQEVFFLDCRSFDSESTSSFVSLLYESCKFVVDPFDSMSYYCHIQYSFLHSLGQVVLSVHELSLMLKEVNHPSLSADVISISKIMTVLNDKSLVLFLPDPDPSKSWVVIDRGTLMTEIVDVLLAPSVVHRNISSETGIITLSTLMEIFPNYNPQWFVEFLKRLEICHIIDASVLNSMSSNLSPLISNSDKLFSPCHVSDKSPAIMNASPSIGLCVWFPNQFKVFSPHSLYALLHRIAYQHCFLPSKEQLTKYNCQVWVNGITWKHKDIEVLLEVSECNRCITLLMSEKDTFNAQKICSTVMQSIDELSASNYDAYMIFPDDLCIVRSQQFKDRRLICMADVLKAIFLRQKKVYDASQEKETNLTDVIGVFEPFFCIAVILLQMLYYKLFSQIRIYRHLHENLCIVCPEVMQLYPPDADHTYSSVGCHVAQYSIFTQYGDDPLVS